MTTNTKPDLIKTLQGLSDRAYCDYVTKMRSDECLGWEAKVQTQRFGKAEIEAHTKAGELLGRHKAFSEAAAKAALSTAAQPPADGALNTNAAVDSIISTLMTQVQVCASAYALIGSRFDRGHERENFETEMADLRNMIDSVLYPAAQPQAGWPRASISDSCKGWTLDYTFLDKVEQIARRRTEYSTSMEATEQVLIAALEVLATAPKAAPAPVAWLQADAAQRDQLLAFTKEVMQAWPEGGIDGGELQDIALAHGLLRPAEPPTDWDGCNFYERTELIK